MHIHFRLLFRRASEPSSSDRTAKQQIAYAQNSSIIEEIGNKIKVQFSSCILRYPIAFFNKPL